MLRIRSTALSIGLAMLLAACGGGSDDGIDENGQCRSGGQIQAAPACGDNKTPTPTPGGDCRANGSCL
jgi:hypothetical protein